MTRKLRKGSAPIQPTSSRAITNPAVTPGWSSGNWSGYALRKTKRGTFHHISGYWIVPQVRPSKSNKYSSAWIGIDGFGNPSLIQTGTAQDYVNGKPVYYAWWEILPAPETRIPYPVSPHDLMYAKISKRCNKKWMILLVNKTKGWKFKKVTRYTGPAVTAEWIMEAPSINGRITKLANYGKMLFKKSRLNHRNPLLKANNRGLMIQNNRVVSTPSLPNKNKDSFIVAYGSNRPSPPKWMHKKAFITKF